MTTYARVMHDDGVAQVVCDLRSDTVTRPDRGMLSAMADAEVGDDVLAEDPTVHALERRVAELLGHEAALFFPTATQANLSAVLIQCRRGDEVLSGESYHLIADEAAGASVLGGVAMQTIRLADDAGLDPKDIRGAIKPDDPHCPVTTLLSLENTVSGRAVSVDRCRGAALAAQEAGLAVHLDGARLFNAAVGLNARPSDIAGIADTVTVCFSKGLGAPAGAVLACSTRHRRLALRQRKILGGAMRQSGVLAAAAIYALDHNVADLAEDHDKAARLAQGLSAIGAGSARQATNMVHYAPPLGTHDALRVFLRDKGILIGAQFPEIRMVCHRDVQATGIESLVSAVEAFFSTALPSQGQPA